MKSELSRRKAREQAFILAFERNFTTDSTEDICITAQESRDFQVNDFTLELVNMIEKNHQSINDIIERHSKGWKISRMSKVSLSLLQLAICEMLYTSDNTNAKKPVSVAINEAVILAKKYSTDEDASFINGVLGSVARNEIGNS